MRQHFPLLFLPISAASVAAVAGITYTIPNSVYDGPVNAEFTSGCGKLDGQKILPQFNQTSFEWWYFDAVSTTSTNESITIVLYESTPEGFIVALAESPISAFLSGNYANGTSFQISAPAAANASAVITVLGDGASGRWETTGFSFTGTPQLTEYTITVDNPTYGINGTITLASVAPAHYPCGPNQSSSTELVCPHVGWANAIPGAAASVDLIIDGEHVRFQGIGYHDKNWGDMPFSSAVSSWYWGHALLGPYTLVWFDTIAADGNEYVSGYVSRDGVIEGASCEPGSLFVRPWGRNSEYPPTPQTGTPEGLAMNFTLTNGETLVANLTTTVLIADASVYARYLGNLEGGVVGGTKYQGKGIWEQFKF